MHVGEEWGTNPSLSDSCSAPGTCVPADYRGAPSSTQVLPVPDPHERLPWQHPRLLARNKQPFDLIQGGYSIRGQAKVVLALPMTSIFFIPIGSSPISFVCVQ